MLPLTYTIVNHWCNSFITDQLINNIDEVEVWQLSVDSLSEDCKTTISQIFKLQIHSSL